MNLLEYRGFLNNPAGTYAFRAMEWAVFIARGKGLLTYQSSFGVAPSIVNAFATDIIDRNSTRNNVRHPKATLIGQ